MRFGIIPMLCCTLTIGTVAGLSNGAVLDLFQDPDGRVLGIWQR